MKKDTKIWTPTKDPVNTKIWTPTKDPDKDMDTHERPGQDMDKIWTPTTPEFSYSLAGSSSLFVMT